MTLVARHAVLTDIGLHREANEDAAVARPPLYAVCDGMGGARAGEVASERACTTLAARVAAGDDVADAARAANAAVYDAAAGDPSLAGMGTTLTAMVLEGAVARFAHVGDSRAYLLREGRLSQVTDDHSVVGQMIRGGELTAEQAAVHPMRSILTRALGTEPAVDVDTYEVEVRAGDVLLLCSDGLTGMVPDERIARLLRHDDPEESAAALVKQARRGGGLDNITVVVVCVDDADDDADAAGEAAGTAAAATDAAGDAADEAAAAGVASAADPALAADDAQSATAPGSARGAAPLGTASASARDAAAREARTVRRLKIVLAVLLVVLVVAAVAAAALEAFYFVGVDEGELVVYSGLPWTLGPLEVRDVYVRGTRTYESLTFAQRELVDELRIRSRADALRLLETLETAP